MTKKPNLHQLKEHSQFYLSKKFYKRALESINQLLEHFPNEELGWTLKGEALIYEGEYDKAYENIKKAIDLEPKSILALQMHCVLDVIRGNYNNAVKLFKKSLEEFPFSTKYLSLLNKEQLNCLYSELKKDHKINSENLETFNKIINSKHTLAEISEEDYEKTHFKSFYLNIKDVLEKKNLKALSEIYERNSWDSLSIDNMKILLEDTDLNLLENIFRTFYPLTLTKSFDEIWNFYYDNLLPKRLLKGLIELIKNQIIELIKKKDEEVLIPLIIYNCLSLLDLEDFKSLIENPNVNFMVLMYQTLNMHYEQLLFFLGDDILFDLIDDLLKNIKKIDFTEFEVQTLNLIEEFFKENLPKNRYAYFKDFDLIFINIQRAIKKKEREESEFNLKELIQILTLAAEGKNDIANGAIGFGGYGFVFRDIDYMENYLKQVDYYPPLIEVGKMRHLKENFKKERPLEWFDYLDFDVNLLITASVKTLIPSLKLRVGDTFFVTWMLVRIPDGSVFPANFYYDKRRMAIGCLNLKSVDVKDKVTNEFLEIFQFNPFDLSQKERDILADSFELALDKVPKSDFTAVFSSYDFHFHVEVDHGEPYWRTINDDEDDDI